MSARDVALAAFREALAALDARRLTAQALAGAAWPGRARVLAFGKAAAAMAAGAADALGDRIARALVVTKDETGPKPRRGRLLRGSHPVPDRRSLQAGRRLLAWARRSRPDETVLTLISGGASALACVPAWGVSLADKVAVTRALAAAGAPISDLNIVRKHLSAIKGGRLAMATRGRIEALLLSDVVGDDLATIGSGPVSPDPSRFQDALAVLKRWQIVPPHAVSSALEAGVYQAWAETLKPGALELARVTTRVLAGPDDLGRAAAASLERAGLRTELVLHEGGIAEALGQRLAEQARALTDGLSAGEQRAYVVSGEPTIWLPPAVGRGGRAQHVALVAAYNLGRLQERLARADVAILCAASDGSDGATAHAGGLVDPQTAERLAAAGIDVITALRGFDSSPALAAAGDLVTTGPTSLNLCDLFIVVVRGREGLQTGVYR